MTSMDAEKLREVQRELERALNVSAREKEPRARFLLRLASKLTSIKKVYLAELSEEAYAWAMAALDILDEGGTDFPDLDEVTQPSLMESLMSTLSAEDAVQDRLSSRTTRQAVRTADELRRSQHEALVSYILRHPTHGERRLVEGLAETGLRVSLRHAREAVGDTSVVMRAVNAMGWKVIDEHGQRVMV